MIVSLVSALFGFSAPTTALAAGPATVNLLSAGNFTILSESGITNTGTHGSAISGNIGSSPITAAAMNDVFCSEITGTIYGVNAAYVGSGNQACFASNPPLSNKTLVDNAVLDMGTAYTDAANRTLPDGVDLYGGNIGGQTFTPGLYKWNSDVNLATSITLSGTASDVWIFQITGDLNLASLGSVPAGVKIILTGGAKASNVFWQVGGLTGTTLGTYSTFNGNILSAKQIILQTGAVLNGRALSQTQVTLDANNVSAPLSNPATLHIIKQVINTGGGTATSSSFNLHVKLSGNDVSNSPSAGTTTPGTAYSLLASTYFVSEDASSSYSQVFSGDCDASGRIVLSAGDDKTCTITNSYDAPTPSSGGGGGGSSYFPTAIAPIIGVTKTANPLALPNGAGSVTYSYAVYNAGTVPMASIALADDSCLPINFISGDINTNGNLDLNETWNYRCTTTLTETHTNVATAIGWASGLSSTASAKTTVVVGSKTSTTPVVITANGQATTTPPVVLIPKLPNTGLEPASSASPLAIAIPVALILLASASIFIVLKKHHV